MANNEQLDLLLKSAKEKNGCASWNDWRKRYPNLKIHLQESDLTNITLANANLKCANLRFSNLSGTSLEKAELQYADLRYTELRAVDLTETNLENAKLDGTNLERACLSQTIFDNACLESSNLKAACLEGASFIRANLYKLEEVTSSQLSLCRNIEGAIYLEKQFLMEIQELSPHLMSWWSKEMIKEIEEVSISTDEEGWTGRWQKNASSALS